MFDCADFGCSIGKEDGGCRIVKIFIRETLQSGFACHCCGLHWWTDNAKNIPELTNEYHSHTRREFYLFDAISSSNSSELYLSKYRPIIQDDEFIAYHNQNQTERLIHCIKNLNRSIISIENSFHIFKDRRLQITNIDQAYAPVALLNKWITQPPRNPTGLSITKRKSQMVFPTHYPNAISREVWDYIKSVNPEIQILNQENEPIPRPNE